MPGFDKTDRLPPRPIWCPIAEAIHPAADEVERRSIEWLDQYQPYADERERARMIATESAHFAARMTPHADGLDGMVASALWNYLGFVFDDVFADDPTVKDRPHDLAFAAERYQRALEVVTAIPIPENPRLERLCAAVTAFGDLLRKLATPVEYARFTCYQRSWLAGVLWEVSSNALGQALTIQQYLAQRLLSGGSFPVLGFLEMESRAISAEELGDARMRALVEMAMTVACLDNDQLSWGKERSLDESEMNAYLVLARQGRTLEQASVEVGALRDRVLSRFLRLRDDVTPTVSPAMRLLLDNLGHTVRANVDWGMNVTRYTRFRGTADDTPRFAAEPVDAQDVSPLIDSIAWWWQV